MGKTLAPIGHAASIPKLVADGAGGGFAVWTVEEPAYSHVSRLYAIRFGADGTPAPGWPADGMHVCPVESSQPSFAVLPTPTGLMVCWTDLRSGDLDIYAQHLARDGTLASGWPASGLAVCAQPGDQMSPALVDDGSGGAIVAWNDRDRADAIFAMRLTGAGTFVPGWPPAGVMVADRAMEPPTVAPDRLGGAYFTWIADVGQEVRARHLAANGNDAPGWLPGASIIGFAWDPPVIAPTGTHDAIVVWHHDGRRADGSDLGQPAGAYAQQLEPGQVVPVLASVRSVEAVSDRVRIAWQVTDAGPPMPVHRRTEDSPWSDVGLATPDGDDRQVFEDHDVEAGARYAYALGDEQVGEVWVDVPVAARFSLEGFTPNPAPGLSPMLSFALDSPAPATLEVFDVALRCVWSRDERGVGRRTIALAADRSWTPGLYVARLSQDGRVLVARGMVLR